MKKIFLFAGEKSGDLLGEKLITSLQKKCPHIHLYGVGGPKMRKQGFECILSMEEFEVMGFVDVFFALPKLLRHFFHLKKELLNNPANLVLFIDYPGFNLALAKSLRRADFPGKICHYICPSVWAWGKSRISKMEQILDRLFVTFPFEKELFNAQKLDVHYVGHPLTQQLSKKVPALEIDTKKTVIALFPGSRKKELMRNFPLQLRVAMRLTLKYPDLLFVVSVASPEFSPLLESLMLQEETSKKAFLFIQSHENQKLIQRAHLALAKSGTNNLELALHCVPTVVTYAIGPLDLFIAKNLLRIRLPHYSLPNILAKKCIFPELIGPHLSEEAFFKQADQLLSSSKTYEECREKCQEIVKILENKKPEEEISSLIKNDLYEGKISL